MNTLINAVSPYFQANIAFHTVTKGVQLLGQTGEAVSVLKNNKTPSYQATAFRVALAAVALIDLAAVFIRKEAFQQVLNTKYAFYGLLALRGVVVLTANLNNGAERKEGVLQALRAGHVAVVAAGALDLIAKTTSRPLAYMIQGAELAIRSAWWLKVTI